MNDRVIPESELVLNDDRSVYHLNLKAEHVADTVLLAGDPGRVASISKHFDSIDFKVENREFITHTGNLNGKSVTVLSTGIGTDNIDIAINELDAAVNINPHTRRRNSSKRKLNLIRIGTSGSIQPDIPVGSFLLSSHGLGLDGLIHYYKYSYSAEEKGLMDEINNHLDWNPLLSKPYLVAGSDTLLDILRETASHTGITVTASGFYGPQGRKLSLDLEDENINQKLQSFQSGEFRITNFEMETSALYGLGKLLGHECATICAILANRYQKEYAEDHEAIVENLIKQVLDTITQAP